MQYTPIWNKVLNSNEEVKYEFSVGERYRKFNLTIGLIFSGLVLIFGLGSQVSFLTFLGILLVIIFVFRFWYAKIANAYAFTNNRVLVHRGWLSTTAKSITYDKITELSVSEPLLSRLFTKTGNMSIHTGNVVDALVLANIATPYEVKKKLDALRNK